MTKSLIDLYSELLGAMENQKKALLEARLDDALELQNERQRIIEDVRKEKEYEVEATDSAALKNIMANILSLDTELQDTVRAKMKDVLDNLGSIRDIKSTLALQGGHHPTGEHISVNA